MWNVQGLFFVKMGSCLVENGSKSCTSTRVHSQNYVEPPAHLTDEQVVRVTSHHSDFGE